MNENKARVIGPGGDYTDPLQQYYKAYLWKWGDKQWVWSHRCGIWGFEQDVDGSPPEESFSFPPEMALPLYNALGKALNITPPEPVADIKELRESLELERRRVDQILSALTRQGLSVLASQTTS